MQWLTVAQFAERVQRSPNWVRNAARTGLVPAIKVGQQWRFEPQEIEQWKQRHSNSGLDPLRMTSLSAKRQGI